MVFGVEDGKGEVPPKQGSGAFPLLVFLYLTHLFVNVYWRARAYSMPLF